MRRDALLQDSYDIHDADAYLARMRDLLEVRMADHQRRHAHSLGVAQTARQLAETYGVDGFLAEAAGLIHDWDKVLTDDELLARAVQYNIPVVGSAANAVAVLHGPVAAIELPNLFKELPACVFQAVARHTSAAVDMTPLDMVVFIADAIEPQRKGDYAEALREQVGKVSLERLFFSCFSQGLVYVISTGRYLYPTALDIYNRYALDCAR